MSLISWLFEGGSLTDRLYVRYSAYHHSHPTLTERLKGLEAFQAKRALLDKKAT